MNIEWDNDNKTAAQINLDNIEWDGGLPAIQESQNRFQPKSFGEFATTPISKLITGKSIGERTNFLEKRADELRGRYDLVTQKRLAEQVEKGRLSPSGYQTLSVPKTPTTAQAFFGQLPHATAQAIIETLDVRPMDVAAIGTIPLLGKIPIGKTTLGRFAKFGEMNPFAKISPTQSFKELQRMEKTLEAGGKLSSRGFEATTEKAINAALTDVISQGINKGIRPTVAGKNLSYSQRQKFDQNSVDAVKDIVFNKDDNIFLDISGEEKATKTPETIRDFAQAIQQGMKRLMSRQEEILGESSATIKTESFIDKLNLLIDDKFYNIKNSADVAKLTPIRDWLIAKKKLTPTEAIELVQELNTNLKAAYRSGFPYGENAKNIMAELTGLIRKEAFDAIDNVSAGEGTKLSGIRKLWGAYKSLSKDVLNRVGVSERQSPAGIWSFLDAAGTGDIVSGAFQTLMGQPQFGLPRMAKGAILKGGKSFIEHINNPNTIIKNMFSKVESLLTNYPKNIGGKINPEFIGTFGFTLDNKKSKFGKFRKGLK